MRIALAQMDIAWENKEANKKKCADFIREAAQRKCQLIIFPEMCLTGFSMNVDGIADKDSKDFDWFKGQAVKNRIAIGFGLVEKDKDGRGRNEFSLVDKRGKELFRYTKLHSFSYEKEDKFYREGEEILSAELEGVKISPFICYDLRFPEIFQAASKKSQLLIVIANWPKPRREHWMGLLKARAIENQAYVAGLNRVGSGGGREYSGDSLIVDPLGNAIAQVGEGGGLLEAEIDANFVGEVRERFRFKKDRREDLYCRILN
ncbi:MAG: carbon-nitrogen family hydrolase [Candidatus Altiarchaeota archaeon]|nr:carbon-nitrogen family hydrolase [Candidatus Altiarchaeota archaeon]